MDRRPTSKIADWLLVIGIGVCAVGLVSVVASGAFPDRAAIDAPAEARSGTSVVASGTRVSPLERSDERGTLATTVGPAPTTVSPTPTSSVRRPANRGVGGRQADARLFLRDAAAAARRKAPGGQERGGTEAALWINNPATIGSTSPRGDQQGTPSDLD